jgi:hypothetical protein
MQSVEGKGTVGKTAVVKHGRVKVSEGLLETHYSFRGPKSHRPVVVTVPFSYWMAAREEKALKCANARYQIVFTGGPFSDEVWENSMMFVGRSLADGMRRTAQFTKEHFS